MLSRPEIVDIIMTIKPKSMKTKHYLIICILYFYSAAFIYCQDSSEKTINYARLKREVKPTVKLIKAIDESDLNSITKYLLKGAQIESIDMGGNTLLMRSIRYSSDETTELLINNGAEINVSNNRGLTPLMYALKYSSEDIIKLLIDKGAEINVSDSSGGSPIMYALSFSSDRAVELLIDKNAEINESDIAGWTPLMYALKNSSKKIIELLIDKGAKINVSSIRGGTPLIYASKYSSEDIIKLLIDKGAEINVGDSVGGNPLIYALIYSSKKIIDFIINEANKKNLLEHKGWIITKSYSVSDSAFNSEVNFTVNTDVIILNIYQNNQFEIKGTISQQSEKYLWGYGAKHTWRGQLTYANYTFNSNPNDELQFEITNKGYMYIKGTGVINTPEKDYILFLSGYDPNKKDSI